MPYIAPEAVMEAKRVDLLTYLQSKEPQELVKIGNGVYSTKSHDSLKISNGKWMWWSRHVGGKSALDYLVKVRDMSFLEAVETVLGARIAAPVPVPTKKEKEQDRRLLLPPKSSTNGYVTQYLIRRGISSDIIRDCIASGCIYESLPYHNAVFVGFDANHEPKYAAYRATANVRILGDCSGSDKHYSFRLADGKSDELHLFECAIDLLSYATLLKLSGKDYQSVNLLSLAGVYEPKDRIEESTVPVALEKYLADHPHTTRIVTHFDNDEVGRKAAEALRIILPKKYEVVDEPPPYGKDFNDFLCAEMHIEKKKERSYVR